MLLLSIVGRWQETRRVPAGLSVLPVHPVAELCHHRLVVGPLPVVDDQSAGLAGEQLVSHGVLTMGRVKKIKNMWNFPH